MPWYRPFVRRGVRILGAKSRRMNRFNAGQFIPNFRRGWRYYEASPTTGQIFRHQNAIRYHTEQLARKAGPWAPTGMYAYDEYNRGRRRNNWQRRNYRSNYRRRYY